MRTRQIAYCATVATALVVAPHRARPLTRRHATPIPPPPAEGARVVISYCQGCKWLLRSAYFAQELLTTFDNGELREVALSPAPVAGTWTVSVDEQVVWDRKADGGFPEAKILKRRVRDIVAPDASIGIARSGAITPITSRTASTAPPIMAALQMYGLPAMYSFKWRFPHCWWK